MTDSRSQPIPEPVRQHTPTPWTLRQFEHSVVLQGPDKIQVMSTSWHGSIRASYPLKAESLANAAFVLEACNSHASLKARVEELETLVDQAVRLINDARSGFVAGSRYDEQWDMRKKEFIKARAALPRSSGEARTEQERGK